MDYDCFQGWCFRFDRFWANSVECRPQELISARCLSFRMNEFISRFALGTGLRKEPKLTVKYCSKRPFRPCTNSCFVPSVMIKRPTKASLTIEELSVPSFWTGEDVIYLFRFCCEYFSSESGLTSRHCCTRYGSNIVRVRTSILWRISEGNSIFG